MGAEITRGGPGSGKAGLLPTLSPNTASILATPKAIRTTETGEAYEIDAVWTLPRSIPETLVAECRRWLVAHDAASRIADEGRIHHWLVRLVSGIPGDYDEETIRLKMGAFVFALSDRPAYCFDDATLRIAMRRFPKFWPSAGELIEFADDMDTWTRNTAARAYKIVDAGPVASVVPIGGTIVERAMQLNRDKTDRERRELAAAAGIDVPTAPQQDPGESDRDYCLRLSALAKAHCADGARALRQAERQLSRAAARPAPAPAEAAAVGESTPAAAPVEGVDA